VTNLTVTCQVEGVLQWLPSTSVTTEEKAMLEPIPNAVERFIAQDDEPVVMLNLLRFLEGGRDLYGRYLRVVQASLAKVSAEILYAGVCEPALVAEPDQSWDAVVVVRYPSRSAFLRMASDPGYLEIAHLRSDGLRETVLQPTKPWTL
jgi:uncharacterized protein (DUF1330 family)